MVEEIDYCGIVSGRTADKVKDSGFEIFYSKLKTAPLIEQCPINLECEVVHILNLGTHSFGIGEVKGSFVTVDCMTDNKPDVKNINPMIFNLESEEYVSFGETIAKAFNVGRELNTE